MPADPDFKYDWLYMIEGFGEAVLALELAEFGFSKAQATTGLRDYLLSMQHAPQPHECEVCLHVTNVNTWACPRPHKIKLLPYDR